MSYAVTVGTGGLAGWRVLNRTADTQKAIIAAEHQVQTTRSRFQNGMSRFTSADDLMSDYRSLTVALTAFGLESDLPNKAFIRKVLESDLSDQKSFANRLRDKRYVKLAEAFSFGDKTFGQAQRVVRADNIGTQYIDRVFEQRVGQTDNNMRLAMNARRELADLAQKSSGENTKWYEILGSPPLREVVSGALGLGQSFGSMPLDSQRDLFKSAAQKQLGIDSLSQLADPATLEKLLDRFIIRASISSGSATAYSPALALLTGGRMG
ncbi:MAG: DUF1217 domain-containing protein [Paracoccus sp. (in: a-proteobacteria)]|uniref:DUF1217 domain-containing protein n=1 Tax=Paracoccus sp. TaxID=267 RepID=UPI0026DEEA2D|nr:DUF1217 domain-containing protein [Paracoccus sp. (in: a-proteobacteria)]MDO5620883.1 DUF1217 domain-containing protein [Paracoccus sp. (in: a-proteobacteria)]